LNFLYYDSDDWNNELFIFASKETYDTESECITEYEIVNELVYDFELQWIGNPPDEPTFTGPTQEPPYVRDFEYDFSATAIDPENRELIYEFD
jgi:hypothetical protein